MVFYIQLLWVERRKILFLFLDPLDINPQFLDDKDLPPYGYENVGVTSFTIIPFHKSYSSNSSLKSVGPKLEFQPLDF